VLIANAQAACRELATYAASTTEKGFTKEGDVLSQHRLIKIITMSLFGFSRGAALSRAFSNRVIGQCDKHGDDRYFHSYRLHLGYTGQHERSRFRVALYPDSKVDLVLNAEPFSYFKPRGVLESTVSVWTEWGNGIGNKASAASDAVGSAHESGERQVGQTVDTTTKAAKDDSSEARRSAAPMRWSRLPSLKSNKPSIMRCKRQRKHAPQPNAPTMLPQKSPAMRLTPRSAVRTI